jgi:hypothetical protein
MLSWSLSKVIAESVVSHVTLSLMLCHAVENSLLLSVVRAVNLNAIYRVGTLYCLES